VTETQTTAPTAGDAGATGDPVASGIGQSVEDVNASWQHRFSQRDRAHNAETEALKAQIEALKTAPSTPPAGESPEAARVRELEAALKNERAARQAAALQSKYPLASSVLGDAVLGMPEEKIAAAEAAMEGGGNGTRSVIDPNAAPRRGAAATPASKPINQKTKQELLADLQKIAPTYQQAAREGLI
jgi:hypothetical protein